MAKKEERDIVILNERIALGESRTVDFSIAKLYTSTKVEIPIIIERSKIPGPTVLITAAIHGDEINGVEIVRQLIARKLNKPKRGTIICIPILNVFGFLMATVLSPMDGTSTGFFRGPKRVRWQAVLPIISPKRFCRTPIIVLIFTPVVPAVSMQHRFA